MMYRTEQQPCMHIYTFTLMRACMDTECSAHHIYSTGAHTHSSCAYMHKYNTYEHIHTYARVHQNAPG